jgi:creatinine amidohydrolase
MHEWKHLTSDEVNALDRRLPVLIPIGLVEAHGPHLALSVDCDTAEYFSRALATRTGAILAPLLPYGYADEMAEYPGTLGVSASTLVQVYTDLSCRLCQQGFTRQIWLSGHGANQVPFTVALEQIWGRYPDAKLAYWNYWTEAGHTNISHADQAETEIALAVGTRAEMTRVRDFTVSKPWFRLRSRHTLQPESGGINGQPSKADLALGHVRVNDIVEKLTPRLAAIIAEERAR